MTRRLIGRIVSGQYINLDEESIQRGVRVRTGPERDDYFGGATPSKLSQLDNRQLFMATERLAETVRARRGTESEQNHAREAINECVREAKRRRATLHD